MECEEDEKLAFLDMLIMKSNDNIELTIYRKPTHSGVFTHFTRFIPHHYKVALVKTLICGAYRHCSSWLLFHEEIENITDMLMNNGYNLSLIENTVIIRMYHISTPQYSTECIVFQLLTLQQSVSYYTITV